MTRRVTLAAALLIVWLALPGIAAADPDTKNGVTADSEATCEVVTFTVTNKGSVDALLVWATFTIPGSPPGTADHDLDLVLEPGADHVHTFHGEASDPGDPFGGGDLPEGTYEYTVIVEVAGERFELVTETGTPPDCGDRCTDPSVCPSTTPPPSSTTTTTTTTEPPSTTLPPSTTSTMPPTTITSTTTTSTTTTSTPPSSTTQPPTTTSTTTTTTTLPPVTSTTGDPSTTLPVTGLEVGECTVLGAVLLAAGVAFVSWAAWRERHVD